MKFFYFLARNITFTFAVCFITIPVAWVLGIYGYLLANSFILMPLEKLALQLIKWTPIVLLISTIFHYIHFGLLTRIGIPAFLKSHRIMNDLFKNNFDAPIGELKNALRYYSDLPVVNMLTAAFYSGLAGVTFTSFLFFDYHFGGEITLAEFKAQVRVVIMAIVFVLILYGMSTYLLTEMLTNNERVKIYNKIFKAGEVIRPPGQIGIGVKFIFFIELMVIALLSYAAMIERNPFSDRPSTFLTLVYIVTSVLASLFLMRMNTRSIVSTLEDLRRVAKLISSGKSFEGLNVLSLEMEFTSIEHAIIEMGDEIRVYRRDLEKQVEQRTAELQTALNSLKNREDLIQKQLDMAAVIQRSLLPDRIDDWNELRFAVRYVGMEKIGGDFYDVIQLKGEKIGIIIGDVSGHGIPAALVSSMAKISFGNAGLRYDSPRKIFQEVNQNIIEHVKMQEYMSCFMIVLDDEYNVVYSNASHQKAILLRSDFDNSEFLDTSGLFIGAVDEARDTYEDKSFELSYGDRIILYTDGIPESLDDNHREYSIRRFEESIIRNRELSIEAYADALMDDLKFFVGTADAHDDKTLIVIELARDEAVDIIKNAKKFISAYKNNEAIEVLEKGISLYPDNLKLIYNLAKTYLRINNFNRTIEMTAKYISNNKRNKNVYYISGAAYYQMQNFDKAIDSFEKALALDRNFINANFALGMAYRKIGDDANARRFFEKVISIDPDNKMALFELKEINK